MDAAPDRQQSPSEPWLLAVDGPSGAGKTTLAATVAGALGAPVLAVEHLYAGWDGLAGTPARLARVLSRWRDGVAATCPVWDWTTSTWGEPRLLKPSGLLVVEGVGSAAGPCADLVDVVVWVEAPAAVRRTRALARDGATYEPHWERWAAQEEALWSADDVRGRADVRVRTG